MARRRLDAELVRRKLAPSRTRAQELIDAGRVSVGGITATKSATQVEGSAAIEVAAGSAGDDYVSRGAYKLLGALEAFGPLVPSVRGQRCLDAGASTGGFTDVLLRQGAQSVVAVDVGYGQLAWRLRQDERVEVLERTNVRYLDPSAVGSPPTLVVADLSFISLTKVLPALLAVAPRASFLLMVKPQFEAGKGKVGAGGVVRDPQVRTEAVLGVAEFARQLGMVVVAVAPSPLPGPAGNVEYFLLLTTPSALAGRDTLEGDVLSQAVSHAVATGPQ